MIAENQSRPFQKAVPPCKPPIFKLCQHVPRKHYLKCSFAARSASKTATWDWGRRADPSRSTQVARETEIYFFLSKAFFFSIDLNNPSSPEAAHPGDVPLHLQGLHSHQKSQGFPSSVPSCPEADGRSQTSPCCRNEFAAHSVPPTVPAGADRSSAPPEAFESCSETGNYTAPLQHRAHPQVKNLYTRTTREQSAHSKEGRRWEGATHFCEKRMGQGMSNSTSTHQQLRS